MEHKVKHARQLPISVYQKTFFLEWTLAPAEIMYNLSGVNKIEGDLDKETLKKACEVYIQRNEVVHAVFSADGQHCHYGDFCLRDFYYESTLNPTKPVQPQIEKLLYEPFDLTKGPLLRLHLVENPDKKEFYFLFVVHHIISDATWIFQFYNQIEEVYNSLRRYSTVPPGVYKTFTEAVEAEQQMLSEDYKGQAQKFWLNLIGDIPLTSRLPYRSGVGAANLDTLLADKTGEFIYFDLSESESDQIRSYAEKNKRTVFVVLSALYGFVLAKYINQEKLILSYPVNTHVKDFKDVSGCFVNNIPMKVELNSVNKLAELIDALWEQRH